MKVSSPKAQERFGQEAVWRLLYSQEKCIGCSQPGTIIPLQCFNLQEGISTKSQAQHPIYPPKRFSHRSTHSLSPTLHRYNGSTYKLCLRFRQQCKPFLLLLFFFKYLGPLLGSIYQGLDQRYFILKVSATCNIAICELVISIFISIHLSLDIQIDDR